jgi:hypothetical protein
MQFLAAPAPMALAADALDVRRLGGEGALAIFPSVVLREPPDVVGRGGRFRIRRLDQRGDPSRDPGHPVRVLPDRSDRQDQGHAVRVRDRRGDPRREGRLRGEEVRHRGAGIGAAHERLEERVETESARG